MNKKCEVCGEPATPEQLPNEPDISRNDVSGEIVIGFDPTTESLCVECYQDKYWIKGEDY